MGTRSLTFVHEADRRKPFVCMYRQFDGYKEGHGKELAEFLAPITLLNGFGNQKAGTHANGMGCLAAQMIAYFKKDIGGFYLLAPDTKDAGQEFEYHVFPNKVRVIQVDSYSTTIFDGSWMEFAKWTNADFTPVVEDDRNLQDALKNSIVSVTFHKVDGTVRVMECTQNFTFIPEDDQPQNHKQPKVRSNPNLVRVYDLDNASWRSFYLDKVISWKTELVESQV